ncbi:MAG TPA: Gfo/Idh/MocA family oxidoreductase [Desulfonatronum sp.]|nr:Gfo/Idh/MocA family oxidoreductase [Desulfonatronum sp.]
MDVLIIGFSSIVRRRVLPAVLTLPGVTKIHVASRCGDPREMIPEQRRGMLLADYETALKRCPPCLCYVSLPNSLHAVWAKKALDKGHHVVLDKPAVTRLEDALALADLSTERGLCLAEANVWPYHPLAEAFQQVIREDGSPPQAVVAVFTSPPLNPDNFRYQPEFGAGALLDRGPYAVSSGRFLFGQVPARIACDIVSSEAQGRVDISFSTTLSYPCGSSLLGFFSLGAVYRNSLSMIGGRYACEAERIFTPPADFRGTVVVQQGNARHNVETASGDTFAAFLQHVMDQIASNDQAKFAEILVQDATVLDEMRKVAQHCLPEHH